MSSQPLISLVIPHLNRTGLLAETLRSIEAQDYSAWEVIVVDDGSVAAEWDAVQALGSERIRVLQRTDGNNGPSRCRNLGANNATGDYLLFVDSDDLLAPWCLSGRMPKVKQVPTAGLWVFPVLIFREHPGDTNLCWNRLEGDDDLERFLRSDPPWHTSSPIWCKEAFSKLGGFNERVMYGDDAELHTRALLKRIDVRKFPDELPDVFIRRGKEQRITGGGWSRSLIESRQVRLAEGTKVLAELNADVHQHQLWEGQYFVECEELLFNLTNPGHDIGEIIDMWVGRYHPNLWRRWLVRMYLNLGLSCRTRAYWAVRVARRVAKMILPGEFFPAGGHFQNWQLMPDELSSMRDALDSTHSSAMPMPGPRFATENAEQQASHS